jgi:hypothetical protein
MKRTFSAALFVLLTASVTGADVKIPSPRTTDHPGGEKAPASSPTTYPDEKGFQARSKKVVKALSGEDLGKWRRGWFARGGDPAKYLIGAAMARLLADPSDEQARKYMNDDRTYKEHYHFGTVNWGRFYPLFADTALTEETRKKFTDAGFRYGSYSSPRGTENHKVMWWTSANVLPYYTGKGLSRRSVEATLKHARKQLREYVKGLYHAGQGEWDSSTYLMFDVNGMLNIYDFSKDPESRLLAKAALDWYTTGYALKYTDGIYCAPNQRGYASAPVKKIADETGYLWWDTHKDIDVEDLGNARHTLHAITSSYRPNKVITHIARKKLPALPAEFRNTKPNYWHGLSQDPTPGVMKESVYLGNHYTMGSLWNGSGGQMSVFQIVAESDRGGLPFTGGHPTGYKYHDGGGKYDQSAQVGPLFILASRIPKDDPLQYVFFSLPEGSSKPETYDGWVMLSAGKTWLALKSLGDKMDIGQTDLSPKQIKTNQDRISDGRAPRYERKPILRFMGSNTGFVLLTGDQGTHKTAKAFLADVKKTRIDESAWHKDGVVMVTMADGKKVQLAYQEGKDIAAVEIDGKAIDYDKWDAVYNGPYVHQDKSVLTVNDGKDGFVVDFTGDLPVYKAWSK